MQVFPANVQAHDIPSNGYLQRYIDGPVLGITFCCSPNNTSILGVMRNVSLQEYCDKAVLASQQRPFLYAGSIGPFPIDTVTAQRLTDWVDKVALSIDYRGILQADFILGESGHLYLLEFNPRWTSSMELVEFVSGRNLIREHLSAQLGQGDRMTLPDHDARSSGFEAIKKIIYAVRELFISQACSDAMMANSNWPLTWDDCHGRVAGWSDIPHPGTRVEAGSPIATAWAIRSLAEQDFALNGKSSNLGPPQDWPEIDELLQSTPIELE
jgi:predicted ATP-grasp superfamily ATP-dependent carboligase